MDIVLEIIPRLALAIGLVLGLIGLFKPTAAANIVRLQPDPAFEGGLAEFRASFGGLFLFVHAVGMVGLQVLPEAHACALLLPISALWGGSAVGRTLSVLVDGTGTKYNLASIAFEAVLAAALLVPCFVMVADASAASAAAASFVHPPIPDPSLPGSPMDAIGPTTPEETRI